MSDPTRSRAVLFALFCLANFAISFNFTALAATVPVMSRELGVPVMLVSQVSAYYMIPYGLGALLYAPLLQTLSLRRILSTAMAVYGVLNLMCAGASSIGAILAARVVMGLAAASLIPLCLIAIGTAFPKATRGRMVGLFFSVSFISSVAGIAMSGICHWRWLFIVPGILGIMTAGLIVVFAGSHRVCSLKQRVDYLKVWRSSEIRRIFIFIFAVSFLYHGVHKWLGVYLDQRYQLSQLWISWFFILISLTGALGQNFGGWLTDLKGRFATCHWGVLLLAGATMLLLGKYPLPGLALILGVFSIGWALGHNGISTVLTDFPDEHRSEIAAMNSAVRFLSGGLGFLIGGPFIEKNIGLTFFAFGVMMLISSFFLRSIIPQKTQIIKGGRYV